MRCEQAMTRGVECVREGDSVLEAARAMSQSNIGFLPVCAPGGEVLGALTDRDIALRVCGEDRKASDTKVRDVMTREVVACLPDDDVRVAESRMAKFRKSRIMVVNETGAIQGVISLADIAEKDRERAGRTIRAVTARERRAA